MPITNQIKTALLDLLIKKVDQKIKTLQSIIDSVIESKNNETKSTAGDKYETGRAMMQAEQEKNEIRLSEAKRQRAILSTIDLKNDHSQVQLGSLIITNKGSYFISIGLGKLRYNDHIYFAISPESPIGKLLVGKKISESFTFNNIEQTIISLI